jgi:YegS/Rv2252/BmrU family lipid kinase
MKILLIYNQQAGHGRTKKLLTEVEAEFINNGIRFDLHLTDYPQHAIEIVKQCNMINYDGIVAAGGDGTLFEVINGYYQNPGKHRKPIGILPVGTGNAFYRDLNPDAIDWREAVQIISQGKKKKVDVGRFKTHGQVYYFINIMGLGFVADVTKTAHGLKILGNISYTLGVLYQTLLLKSHRLTIEIDGKSIERDNIFVEISNTRYTSNFLMAPFAKIDDGLLDITLANNLTRRRLLKLFPSVFTGEHIHADEVDTFQAKHIKIQTDVSKVLTPDGELIGITPVEVECLHRDVEVFWP